MARRALPWWFWAASAAVLVGGGAVYVSTVANREQMRRLLRAAAARYGVDPNIADAVGKHESPNWNSTALNCTGADLARGCAIGSTQITLKTAQAHGFTGTVEQLRYNPALQAELTAKILKAGGASASSLSAAAAWWNAGKTSLSLAPAVTQTTYYPKLLAAYAYVRSNPV